MLLVQGRALEDLQAAEAALREAGLAVASGAASAGDGGAEVEMRASAPGAPEGAVSALHRLSGRERVLLLAALPLVLLLAGWRLAWVPLAEAARGAEAAPASAAAEAAPLATRITAGAEASGMSLSRLEPEGEALRVAVAEAPFAQVVLWLADLEAEGVIATAVEMDRGTAPGAVTARVLLEDAR